MQAPGARDAVHCVQLGRLAPMQYPAGTSLDDLAKKFICPTCAVRKSGEIYPVRSVFIFL
jgi:hypothetical protein